MDAFARALLAWPAERAASSLAWREGVLPEKPRREDALCFARLQRQVRQSGLTVGQTEATVEQNPPQVQQIRRAQ